MLRLSDSACIECTEFGTVLHSLLGDLVLEGPDASRFVRSVLDQLDGPRDARDLAEHVAPAQRRNLARLLELLERNGIVEPVDESADRWREQRRFFAACTDDGARAQANVEAARVLIVGLPPWAAAAARALAASGVAEVQLVDESRRQGATLAAALKRQTPECRIAARTRLPNDAFDLVIGGLHGSALTKQRALSRHIVDAGLTALFASLNGMEAHIGPAIVDGGPPCRECCHHRMLAHAPDPWAAQVVQRSLERDPRPAAHPVGLVPTAGLVGNAVAMRALQLLTAANRARLSGRLLVLNLVSLALTEHRIVPLPWCEICGGATSADEAPLDWAAIEASQTHEELVGLLAGWSDQRTGVLPEISARRLTSLHGALPYVAGGRVPAYCDGATEGAFDRPYRGPVDTFGGKGFTPGTAIARAMAEGLERYSSARVRREALTRCRIDQLAGDVVDPRRMALYDDDRYERPGFPFQRFDAERPHLWVRGRWADSNGPVWVPAALAFYHEFPPSLEDRFVQITSNGLAAGRGYRDAARRAIFELVERDAFMITWLGRLAAPRLELDDRDDRATEVVRGLEELGAEMRLYLLDAGLGICVVVCIAYGDGNAWPGVTVALGADTSASRAVRAAVLEQAYSGPFLRQTMLSGRRRIPREPHEVSTFLDHALFYVPPSRAAACRFLDQGDVAPIAIRALPEDNDVSLEDCARTLRTAGARVALVDVTSPDVALSGLRVVRAVSERTQPLSCGYGLEPTATDRLRLRARGPLNRNVHPLS